MIHWTKPDVEPPPYVPRSALLDWLRAVVPDIRILHQEIGGERVCAAQFSLGGRLHEYNARGPDADDTLVRVCYAAVARQLGLPGAATNARALERDIVAAAARGDTELADRLGRELAMSNAAETRWRRIRTQFGNRPT